MREKTRMQITFIFEWDSYFINLLDKLLTGLIRIRKSKDRQCLGQQKNNKKTNNDLQKNTQNPLKTGCECRCYGSTRRVTVQQH